MRVKVLEAASPYYNYGIVQLVEGEEVKGGLALFLLETGAMVEPLDGDAKAWGSSPQETDRDDSDESEELDAELVAEEELDINATAADILAWVDDDPERAAEALVAEQAKDKPRSTLVKALEKVASEDED